jgi:hypothetical protein
MIIASVELNFVRLWPDVVIYSGFEAALKIACAFPVPK